MIRAIRIYFTVLLRKVFRMSQQLDDLIKTEAEAEIRITNAVALIGQAAQLKTDLDAATAALAQATAAATADAATIADLNTKLAAAIAALPAPPAA